MYQCQNCGGGLHFDIPTQQLKCDYCQSLTDPSFFQDTINGAEETTEFEVTKFICSQCGAEIISQDNTAAAFCSFCGTSTLLTSRLSLEKKPDAILPFKKTKEDCVAAYRKMMKRAIFAPKELKDAKCIDSFRGIYMPYWVYDVSHTGSFCLNGETYSRSGSYDITKHYNLMGDIDAEYLGITHDASKEFADDISEALAPYNVREMQNFNASYLSGFYADISDVNSRIYDQDVIKLTNDISCEYVKLDKNFMKYTLKLQGNTRTTPFTTSMPQPHYALFPVWFMSYRNKDRITYVSINGQTGQIAADIPVDIKKYTLGSLLLAIPLFVLLNFFVSMRASTVLGAAVIISILMVIFSFVEVHKLIQKNLGMNDRGLRSATGISRNVNYSFFGTIKERWFKKKELLGILFTLISILPTLLILLLHPVSDYIYYGGTFVSMAAIFFAIRDIIKDFNLLATRKLPQFNRRGGDDDVD